MRSIRPLGLWQVCEPVTCGSWSEAVGCSRTRAIQDRETQQRREDGHVHWLCSRDFRLTASRNLTFSYQRFADTHGLHAAGPRVSAGAVQVGRGGQDGLPRVMDQGATGRPREGSQRDCV